MKRQAVTAIDRTGPHDTGRRPAAGVSGGAEARVVGRARARLAIGLVGVALLSSAALAAARWPSYWLWIAPEQTPMTFVQSLLLFLSAIVAAQLALLHRLRGEAGHARRWAVWSLGFAALMVDERFALHERLRDSYLAGLGVGLPWGAPGDYILGAVAVAGLATLPWLWPTVRDDRLARRLLVSGVALAAAIIAVDSIDVARFTVAGERLQQTLEEVAEAVAGALLASSVGVVLITRLAEAVPLPTRRRHTRG